MKTALITLTAGLLIAGAANAAILLEDNFDNGVVGTGGTGNTNGGFTVVELGGTASGAASETGGQLTLDALPTNNNSGVFSSAFNPTTYSSMTVTWDVASYTAASNNGFSLFLSSANTGITTPLVEFKFEASQAATFGLNANDGVNAAATDSDAITVAESRNGFVFTATFDATGITYSATGLSSLAGNSIAYTSGQSYSSLFDSTTFVGARTQAAGGTDAQFVLNSISVTAVPEPSSYALLAGMLGLSYVMVRRR